MNHSKLAYLIFCLSLSLLISCGGGGSDSDDADSSGSNNDESSDNSGDGSEPPPNVIIDTDGDGVLDDEDIDDDNDGLIEISTLQQLDWMRNDTAGEALVDHDGNVTFSGCPGNVCSGYELVADLDFDTNGDGMMDANDTYFDYDADGQNNGWLPIGWLPDRSFSQFFADFEGNNHRISNLYIDRTSSNDSGMTSGLYLGLFGYLDGALRPLNVRNIVFDGDNAFINGQAITGALAGQINSNVSVSNISSTVPVTGVDYYLGGLVGTAADAEIVDSTSSGNVVGDNSVGGVVGHTGSALVIRNSFALGNVTGRTEVGGLLGQSSGADTSIIDSGASGNVSAVVRHAGGLVGRGVGLNTQGLSIESSSASGTVSSEEYAGGLVGILQDNGSITASYASGNVSGDRYVGGVVGYMAGATVSGTHASGDVDGQVELTGGLVGEAESIFSITTSYATGNITGFNNTGGLIGRAYGGGNLAQCYFTGTVAATSNFTGGIIGNANYPTTGSEIRVEQVFVTGDVSGTDYVGGLIGLSYDLSLVDSFATGTVTGTNNYIGGLIGDANDQTILTRGLAANVVTPVSTTSIGALVGYSSGVSYTDNYHADDQGIVNAIGQNLDGGSNPAGTTGDNLANLQFVTGAGENGLFMNWGIEWDFGSNIQLPGLIINGVIFRDGDADGVPD